MDNQKQCEGCFYYRPISTTGNAHCAKCCHYYLDTLQRRVEKKGVCLCRMTAEEMMQKKLKKHKKK